MNNENENNKQENLGGTTNLSLDQLKAEGGATTIATDNPDQLDNADDLHEIQAADDLNEPGEEDELDETGAAETADEDDNDDGLDDDDLISSEDLNEENAENPENNT